MHSCAVTQGNAMKKTIIILAVLFTLCGTAEAVQTSVVNGNTYTAYIISKLDIVSSTMEFNEKGGLLFSGYEGNGFYFTLTNFFVGVYWSLNQTIGTKTGDVIFLMVGNTFDPFIYGTGTMTIEYSDTYGMVFFGFRVVE